MHFKNKKFFFWPRNNFCPSWRTDDLWRFQLLKFQRSRAASVLGVQSARQTTIHRHWSETSAIQSIAFMGSMVVVHLQTQTVALLPLRLLAHNVVVPASRRESGLQEQTAAPYPLLNCVVWRSLLAANGTVELRNAPSGSHSKLSRCMSAQKVTHLQNI